MFAKDSDNQYKVQTELLKRWKGEPMLGYMQPKGIEAKVVVAATPTKKLRLVAFFFKTAFPAFMCRFYGEKKASKAVNREIVAKRKRADDVMSALFWNNL